MAVHKDRPGFTHMPTRDDGPMRRTTSGGKASTTVKAWCYLCGDPHLYMYPCSHLERKRWYVRPEGHA